jgi:hypothetical protein
VSDNCPALPDGVEPRPQRVSLQRTTRNAVYKFVLSETADRRAPALKDAPAGPTPAEPVSAGSTLAEPASAESAPDEPVPAKSAPDEPVPAESAPVEPTNTESKLRTSENDVGEPKKKSDYYSDDEADIIMGSPKEPQNKKTAKPDFNAIADRNPIVWQAVFFLCALHSFIDNASVTEMDAFITKYITCGIEPFEKFAESVKKDHCSIENAILDRTINNGMIEGFNNKIKLLRRIRYGHSKHELLNAFSVLSTLKNGKFRFSDFTPVKYRDLTAVS